MSISEVAVLIPAYQPAQELISLVQILVETNFHSIIIVDDGSGAQYQEIFSQLNQFKKVELLAHETNQGKGAALKTGLRYLLETLHDEVIGVVTADADGQHLLKDIEAVAQGLLKHPDELVMGERQFDQKVPLRSRFGNALTRILFGWIYRSQVKDTQTGLRGIPLKLAKQFLTIPFEGYEFEFECLIDAIDAKYTIHSVPIRTVYVNENETSHFRPVIDSVKIYYVFFRYILIAIASFLLDLGIFVPLHYLTNNILLSLFVARLGSATFNFFQNKFVVYRSRDRAKIRREIIQYLLLALTIFCSSYLLISVFHLLFHIGVIWSKVIADVILFFISFLIQRYLVFK